VAQTIIEQSICRSSTDKATGDAWLGLQVFRWRKNMDEHTDSRLSEDGSAAGLLSPLKGYEAGADPRARRLEWLVLYAGIVFQRAAIQGTAPVGASPRLLPKRASANAIEGAPANRTNRERGARAQASIERAQKARTRVRKSGAAAAGAATADGPDDDEEAGSTAQSAVFVSTLID
jgi:hypothetical protein